MGKQGKHACDDDGPNEQKTLERSIEVKLIKGAVKNHFDFYSPFYGQRGLIIRSKETLNMVEIVRESMYIIQKLLENN